VYVIDGHIYGGGQSAIHLHLSVISPVCFVLCPMVCSPFTWLYQLPVSTCMSAICGSVSRSLISCWFHVDFRCLCQPREGRQCVCREAFCLSSCILTTFVCVFLSFFPFITSAFPIRTYLTLLGHPSALSSFFPLSSLCIKSTWHCRSHIVQLFTCSIAMLFLSLSSFTCLIILIVVSTYASCLTPYRRSADSFI
jgi:hypothetical protein